MSTPHLVIARHSEFRGWIYRRAPADRAVTHVKTIVNVVACTAVKDLTVSIHHAVRRSVREAAPAQRMHGHEPATEHAAPKRIDHVASVHHPGEIGQACRNLFVDLLFSGVVPLDS